jgi:hypothetical protein
MMALGLVLVGCYVVVPQDNVRLTQDHNSGQYKVVATPGFGYRYRWDADGDEAGEWDSEDFGDLAEQSFSLQRGKTRVVRLQVENVFGQVNEEKFEFVRPSVDYSKGGPTQIIELGADGKLRPGGARKKAAPNGLPGTPNANENPQREGQH